VRVDNPRAFGPDEAGEAFEQTTGAAPVSPVWRTGVSLSTLRLQMSSSRSEDGPGPAVAGRARRCRWMSEPARTERRRPAPLPGV